MKCKARIGQGGEAALKPLRPGRRKAAAKTIRPLPDAARKRGTLKAQKARSPACRAGGGRGTRDKGQATTDQRPNSRV
jgi:hypothetical protein